MKEWPAHRAKGVDGREVREALLKRLHAHPPSRDQVSRDGFQSDFFEERQAMARCGASEGFHLVVAYLNDARTLLAERAHSQLLDHTGVDHGKDASAGTVCLVDQRVSLHIAGDVTASA